MKNAIGPGTRVRMGADSTIDGTVLAVEIRAQGVSRIEVVWWIGANRQTEWLTPEEIEINDAQWQPLKIEGFALAQAKV